MSFRSNSCPTAYFANSLLFMILRIASSSLDVSLGRQPEEYGCQSPESAEADARLIWSFVDPSHSETNRSRTTAGGSRASSPRTLFDSALALRAATFFRTTHAQVAAASNGSSSSNNQRSISASNGVGEGSLRVRTFKPIISSNDEQGFGDCIAVTSSE